MFLVSIKHGEIRLEDSGQGGHKAASAKPPQPGDKEPRMGPYPSLESDIHRHLSLHLQLELLPLMAAAAAKRN